MDGRFGGKSARAMRWVAVMSLLLIPFTAMQLSPNVHWTIGDFIAAAALLAIIGLAWEVAVSPSLAPARKVLIGGALAGSALLVWAQEAVGIF